MQRQIERSQQEALRLYIDLMDRAEYFEAHEVLEAAWYPLRKEQSASNLLLKGLINGAVALEHIKRGKPGAEDRAQRVMGSFRRGMILLQEQTSKEAEYFQKAYERVFELMNEKGVHF